jgi:DNA-binding MarR family transcriptional regulator
MPDLPRLTGFLLRRAYVKAVDNARECIGEDTHVREVAVLAILDERGPQSQRHLADLTRVNPTIMVKLVDSLEARGWVVRERNPRDRRSYALRLTGVGTRALTRLQQDLDEGEGLLTACLTRAQRAQLRKILLALLEGEAWLMIDSLAGNTGFLIAQAHRLVRGWALEALDPLHLDPRDFGVLSTIGRDQPCSQNHLAQELGVSGAAALTFVEDLEAVGLVHRVRKVGDRRSYDLTLTEPGAARLRQAQAAAVDVQSRVVERLGRSADEQLRRLLARIVAG